MLRSPGDLNLLLKVAGQPGSPTKSKGLAHILKPPIFPQIGFGKDHGWRELEPMRQLLANAAIAASCVASYRPTKPQVTPQQRNGGARNAQWVRHGCSPQLMPTRRVRGAGGRGPSVERDHCRARERQRSENPAFSLKSAGPEAAPRSEFAPSARHAALEHLATPMEFLTA